MGRGMSESDHTHETDPNRRLHLDRSCPDNHVEISRDLLAWLHTHRESPDAVVRMERLRRENRVAYRTLMANAADEQTRRILAELLENGVCTLTDFDDALDCSRKTVRRRLQPLENSGAVEKRVGRPPTVAFTDEATRILAYDTVSYYGVVVERKNSHNTLTQHNNTTIDTPPVWTDSVQNGKHGESEPYGDPFAHVEVGDPGHAVEFSAGGDL